MVISIHPRALGRANPINRLSTKSQRRYGASLSGRAEKTTTLAEQPTAAALPVLAQEPANQPNTNWPGHQEGDYVIKDHKFVSRESLPESKLRYTAARSARRNKTQPAK
jgi:hypothetical protein